MAQIALPLDWPVADADEDFLLSEANRAAFDHLKRWSVWPVMATLLTGPRKSGRSLLGRIFVRKTGGRLFDNAEDHDEEALFHDWNQAQEMRRPLLIVADRPAPAWDITLPDLRSRLTATPHVTYYGQALAYIWLGGFLPGSSRPAASTQSQLQNLLRPT